MDDLPLLALKLSRWLILLAFLPLLINYGLQLWAGDCYRFFPAAVAAALLLARRELTAFAAEAEPPFPAPARSWPLLTGTSLALLAAGMITHAPWLGYVAFLLFLLALSAGVGGAELLKKMCPAICVLACLIRPPGDWETATAAWLRALLESGCAQLLDASHVPALASGAALDIPGRRIGLDEAWRGLAYVPLVALFGLFCGFWRQRPALHSLALGLLGAVFGVLVTFLWVSGGTFLNYHLGIHLLAGPIHKVISWFWVGVQMLLVLSADQLLLCLPLRASPQETPAPPPTTFKEDQQTIQSFLYALYQERMDRLPTMRIFALSLVAGAFGIVYCATTWGPWQPNLAEPNVAAEPALKKPLALALPDSLAGWQQLPAALPPRQLKFLMRSDTLNPRYWVFRKESLVAIIQFGYTDRNAPELCTRYRSAGWWLKKEPQAADAVEAFDLVKPNGAGACLFYKTVTLRPEAQSPEERFQLQLLMPSRTPFAPMEKAAGQALFQALAKHVESHVASASQTPFASALPRPAAPSRLAANHTTCAEQRD